MGRLASTILAGAAAGAAGTTALNATTYLDMAVRGRPSSSTPEQAVERMADEVGVRIPGEGDARQNRVSGLGPLTGVFTGVGVGAVGGALLRALRPPLAVAAVVLGGTAMGATDASMAALGVSDPRRWSASSWLSDAVPHLAYGLVTAATFRRLARGE